MAGDETLGRSVLELSTDQTELDAGINKAKKSADSLEKKFLQVSKSMQRIGKSMTTFVTLPILGIGAAIVKVASDAEETRSKFATVFRDQATAVEQWADTYADSVNRGRVETLGFLATVQDLFVPLGASREAAAEFSKTVVSLSTDLGSFNNMPTSDVLRDIQSTLIGNHETTRKFGVIIDQVTLNQELLNMGVEDGVKAATALEKAQARLNMILAATTDAQGDAIRTAGSFANQMKGLKSSVGDLAEAFGALLLPELSKIVEQVTEWTDRIAKMDEGQKKLILRIAGIGAVAGPATLALSGMLRAVTMIAAHPVLAGLAALGALIGVLIIKYQSAKIEQERLNEERREAIRLAEEEEALKKRIASGQGTVEQLQRQVDLAEQLVILREKDASTAILLGQKHAPLARAQYELALARFHLATAQGTLDEKTVQALIDENDYIRKNFESIGTMIPLIRELESEWEGLVAQRNLFQAQTKAIADDAALVTAGASIREMENDLGALTAATLRTSDAFKKWKQEQQDAENAAAAAMDDLIAKYEEWGSVIIGAVSPALERIGEQIATGKVEWESFADAGKSAIATVVRSFARQWALQAAVALVPGLGFNPVAALGYGAAAAGALVAAGFIESLAGGGFVPSPTLAVVGDAPGGEFVLNQGQMAGILGGRGGGGVIQHIYGHVWQDRTLSRLARGATARASY